MLTRLALSLRKSIRSISRQTGVLRVASTVSGNLRLYRNMNAISSGLNEDDLGKRVQLSE